MGCINSPDVCFSGDVNLSPTTHPKIVCYVPARSLASLNRSELLDGVFLLSHRGQHEQSLPLSQKMKSSSLHLGKLQASAHSTCKRQAFPWEKHLCEHGVSPVWWPLAQCFPMMRAVAWQRAQLLGHPSKHTFSCALRLEAACIACPCFRKRLRHPARAEGSQH